MAVGEFLGLGERIQVTTGGRGEMGAGEGAGAMDLRAHGGMALNVSDSKCVRVLSEFPGSFYSSKYRKRAGCANWAEILNHGNCVISAPFATQQ